jgi:hypothetical protein
MTSPEDMIATAARSIRDRGEALSAHSLVFELAAIAAAAIDKIGGGYVRAKPTQPVRPGKPKPKDLS